jgi:uncharacterized integral membrane protein
LLTARSTLRRFRQGASLDNPVAARIFMLQNTRSVEVSFLRMHGNLPLALALLVAAVGAAILTLVVGAARITQLRRLSRSQRH